MDPSSKASVCKGEGLQEGEVHLLTKAQAVQGHIEGFVYFSNTSYNLCLVGHNTIGYAICQEDHYQICVRVQCLHQA